MRTTRLEDPPLRGGRNAALIGLGVAGLVLYLWPAVAAPTVLWSDSRLDLEWARSGSGIWKPIPDTGEAHVAKAGYLLFLRAAMKAVHGVDEPRSIVVVQTLLLWMSIAGSCFYLGRRTRWEWSIALYLLLIGFLRLRDSASAVMTESISAAGLLPLVLILLFPPWRRPLSYLVAGAGAALLFWIRPNVGAVALLLAAVSARPIRGLIQVGAGFAAIALPVWLVTRPAEGEDSMRGLSHPIIAGAAEYYWLPSIASATKGTPKERAAEEFRITGDSWKALVSRRDIDARRELAWRCLDGFFGAEYYDARWSSFYRRLTEASRLAAPFLVLGAVSILLVLPFRETLRVWNWGAPLLLLSLIAQNLVFGSHPRYVLPFVPAVLLVAVVGASSLTARRGRVAVIVTLALALLVFENRGALAWEWGRLESAGIILRQRLPRASLPASGPATLHLRIATGNLPTEAGIEVLGENGRVLPSGRRTEGSQVLAVSLPPDLLEVNASRPVEIFIRSVGNYDPYHFMLFPIVPPPWSTPATREASQELSPSTGVRMGSLDWWAHPGTDSP
jgi:hypothetical protein